MNGKALAATLKGRRIRRLPHRRRRGQTWRGQARCSRTTPNTRAYRLPLCGCTSFCGFLPVVFLLMFSFSFWRPPRESCAERRRPPLPIYYSTILHDGPRHSPSSCMHICLLLFTLLIYHSTFGWLSLASLSTEACAGRRHRPRPRPLRRRSLPRPPE